MNVPFLRKEGLIYRKRLGSRSLTAETRKRVLFFTHEGRWPRNFCLLASSACQHPDCPFPSTSSFQIPVAEHPILLDLHVSTKCPSFVMPTPVHALCDIPPPPSSRSHAIPEAERIHNVAFSAPENDLCYSTFTPICLCMCSVSQQIAPALSNIELVAAAWAAALAPLAQPRLRCHAAAPLWPTAA